MEDLISVIMSTYNEPIIELKESIGSVLRQTYTNIEFIIVIDNPENEELRDYIYSLSDPRLHIIENPRNIGLVQSLNKAIISSKGNYIARMDADDICRPNRLELQKSFMDKYKLDLVGGSINLIDVHGRNISNLHFPQKQCVIKFFLKWGNCLPHPTWLVRREVYSKLNGYKNVPRCEDYEFICRTIRNNFRIGNVKEYILKYRIREESISNSNQGEQYILRKYLSRNRHKEISENKINNYMNSNVFHKKIDEYNKFQNIKKAIKESPRPDDIIELLRNPNLYSMCAEKIFLKLRNII